jgi:hypothetical protein
MKFFEGCKPQVFLHGAKLRRDKKTGKRLWGLTFIVTLQVDQVLTCDAVIEKAFEYLLTLENAGVEVSLDAIAVGLIVDFYALLDDKKPTLHVDGVSFEGLRLTRTDQTVELWFQCEIENNAGLHAFIKEYAFTRFWAEFTPCQGELGMKPVAEGKLPKKS